MTGMNANKAIAALSRDTVNTHVVAKDRYQRPGKQARAEQTIKTAVTAQAFKFSDDAYRTMFLREHKVYRAEQDASGNVILKTEKQNSSNFPKRKNSACRLDSGKVRVGINGIFNDADAAAYYAGQHNGGATTPLYIVSFPPADSAVGELMVAGYQKFLENDFWGLANSTQEVKNLMDRYGSTGLLLDAHSRGAMTVGNALESLSKSGAGYLTSIDINFTDRPTAQKSGRPSISSVVARKTIESSKSCR